MPAPLRLIPELAREKIGEKKAVEEKEMKSKQKVC
jgi:hypothetical protein